MLAGLFHNGTEYFSLGGKSCKHCPIMYFGKVSVCLCQIIRYILYIKNQCNSKINLVTYSCIGLFLGMFFYINLLIRRNTGTKHIRIVNNPYENCHAVVQAEEVKQSVKHIPHTVGGLQYVLDILPGLILTLFFPYQSGIACYCCQRCAQFMGDSMYRLLP